MHLSSEAGVLWAKISQDYSGAGFPLASMWSVPMYGADDGVVQELEGARFIARSFGQSFRLTEAGFSEIWRS